MAPFGSRAAGWLSALALSACAAGGPLPQPAGMPPEATIAGADGSPLALSVWEAETPRAAILALHGFGDHGESTFKGPAAWWAEQGITTWAYDQRGFGRNASRGQWPGADALIADARAAVAGMRRAFPCMPLILLGHSMGGGVALAAAEGSAADALVLAAPAIWGGDHLNPLHRLLAWSVAAVAPDRRFSGRGVVRIQASDNIEALLALGRDPLYLSPPSAREILGLVRITDRAEAAASGTTLPALLLLGRKDQIVPFETVREIFARLPGPRREILYDEGWHLLFRDLQAARVWQDAADFALAQPPHCPAQAAARGSSISGVSLP